MCKGVPHKSLNESGEISDGSDNLAKTDQPRKNMGSDTQSFVLPCLRPHERAQVLSGKVCPYCGATTEYVDSEVIYGRSYGMVYLCRPCDAYVGVHKGTDKALGRLANAELREWKKKAHAAFDPVWKERQSRNKAYKWLSKALGINRKHTHIGMFDIEECKRTVEVCRLRQAYSSLDKVSGMKPVQIGSRFRTHEENERVKAPTHHNPDQL